LLYPTEL